MKRTIKEIKQEMTDMFVQDDDVAFKYGLDQEKDFDDQFSIVSIENTIFYIVACAIWSVKNLFEILKTEIRQILDLRTPHTVKWYHNKVIRFQYPSENLVKDKDYYDNTGMTEEDIEKREVIKFCAIDDLGTELQVKIATEKDGKRAPLGHDDEDKGKNVMDCLKRYLNEIKDAGVRIKIINEKPDLFSINVAVYYDPLYLTPQDELVEKAIKDYIANLPFNSAISMTKLVDIIQGVKGVVLVNIKSCKIRQNKKNGEYGEPEDLDVQKIPVPGYYEIEEGDDKLIVRYIRHTNQEFKTAEEHTYESIQN